MTRDKQQATIRRYGLWIIFLAVPLIVNGIVWKGFVIPQQKRVNAWREAKTVSEVKPKLKILLAESHQVRLDWGKASFTKDYPSVMQLIQQLAGRHSVHVTETRMKGQEAQGAAGGQTIPLELEVSGSFSKLARWMSDIESQYGFRIESWSVGKPSSGDLPELTLKLTVFAGGA